MSLEISDRHREIFKSLASGWLRVGAACVQLLDGDEVLVGCPNSAADSSPSLTVNSRASNLSLRVYGIADPRWMPTAESMLDIFTSLLTADADLDSLTAALVETQDRLVAIYELTQATRRTLDVPALLDLLLQQSKHLLDVDGGFVILKEKGRKSIVHQVSENPLHPAHVEAAATLYQRDPNRHIFKESETLPAGLRNVMMVSLPVREEISAAVGLFNKTGNFTTPDIKLAQAIAGHIGAQLENAMLHKEAVERARLETEMDIARKVQTAILPQTLPVVDGLDVYASSIPAFEVGGDFFDVVDRNQDCLVFAVGDVTGKGMPAALLMSMTHTVIKSASRNMPFTNPHQVTRRLNHDMFNDFSSVGMFATVLIGQLDRRNQTLSYCNAGQSPIYYLPVDGDSILLAAQDVPVGILEDYEYSTQTLKMSPGDIFVAASDGFPESCNPAEEMYGYERMAACLLRLRDLPSAEIAARLLADVNDFCDSHPQNDDRTVVVIKMTGLRERNVMPTESMIIRANYNDIRIPCERLRGFLKEAGVSDDLIDQCELPLQELLTNLVDHAYVGDESGRIIVNLSLDGGNLAIETRDTGAPLRLDLARISMPDPAELAEGGYGMAIIQSLMDKVEYSSTQGTNIWKLVKRLK